MHQSPASRAHNWAVELTSLSEDELHWKVSSYLNNLFNEGDTYSTFRTMSTFLLGYHLKIKLSKLWIYDRFITELDRAILHGFHDTSMFVPYESLQNS